MITIESSGDSTRANQLLAKIQADPSLPALGNAVFKVVQIASGNDDAVQNLSRFILSDVALTKKILTVANTVEYRTLSRPQVTTVSRAIFLLGFDSVKTIALAMLIVEGLTGKSAQFARVEMLQALGASLIGRELARRSGVHDTEAASIVALFKNLGRLLVAVHDPAAYQEIRALSVSGDSSLVAMRVLGCGFSSLAEAVLRSWQIPVTIVNALQSLPTGVLKVAHNEQEWLQQVGAFSAELACQLFSSASAPSSVVHQQFLSRYGVALHLNDPLLAELIRDVVKEAELLARYVAPIVVQDDESIPQPIANINALNDFLLTPSEETLPHQAGAFPSGKPYDAHVRLLAGVQEISDAIASGLASSRLLMPQVAEVLCSAMGFRFVAICLLDERSDQYRAAVSHGLSSESRMREFVWPSQGVQDLFHLALHNNVDITIADAYQANVRAMLPGSYTLLLADAASLVMLPLVIKNKPLGLIYADRANLAPEGVAAEEGALIKTLKAQLMMVLRKR